MGTRITRPRQGGKIAILHLHEAALSSSSADCFLFVLFVGFVVVPVRLGIG